MPLWGQGSLPGVILHPHPSPKKGNVEDRFGGQDWGDAPGVQWLEARDAAKYPLKHSTGQATKNYLA